MRQRPPLATANSWPHQPMPAARIALPFSNHYSASDYARIARGYVPQGSDDPWFVYLSGDCLSFHRSVSGYCIYQVQFAPTATGVQAVAAWANRDRAQFRRDDIARDVGDLERLIEHYLLHWAYLTPEEPPRKEER